MENHEHKAAEANPFLVKEVACPLCAVTSPQRRLKRHLFAEQNRDIDLRPRHYQWRKKELARFHPLLHYLWHCPRCRFTARPDAYENPIKGLGLTMNKFRAALAQALIQDQAARRAIDFMCRDLGEPPLDHLQGLRLHLLAIHQAQLLQAGTGVEDSLNLGRYALRLSWIYQEMDEDSGLAPIAAQAKELLDQLRPLWPQAPADAEAAARLAVQAYENAVRDSRAIEDVGELCNLILLVTRIHLKLRQVTPARQHWGKAFELARNVEGRKADLEGIYYQLQEKTRAEAKAVADMAKAKLAEVTAQIVEQDAKARGMRFKVQEVRDLINDVVEDMARPPSAPAPGQAEVDEFDLTFGAKPKPRKKLRDYFK